MVVNYDSFGGELMIVLVVMMDEDYWIVDSFGGEWMIVLVVSG